MGDFRGRYRGSYRGRGHVPSFRGRGRRGMRDYPSRGGYRGGPMDRSSRGMQRGPGDRTIYESMNDTETLP